MALTRAQTIVLVCIFLLVLVLATVVYKLSSTPEMRVSWSEWVADASTPSCGSGTTTYTRKCTLNSVVQGSIDTCVKLLGESDTKTDTYTFDAVCPVVTIGRYVIIERHAPSGASSDVLNFADIQILDTSGNSLIVDGVTATAGSTLSNFPPSNLIDGDVNTFAHTLESDVNAIWLKIDLMHDTPIFMITLKNRRDCCWDRAVGARIRVVNEAGDTVFTSKDIDAAQANDPSREMSWILSTPKK